MPIRYVTLAYGTRQEILDQLRGNLGAHRSERRRLEAQRAIEDLEAGDNSVTTGGITYMVEADEVSRHNQPG